jgi:septal ring factor EnvC (AmiA/AmiB activator)
MKTGVIPTKNLSKIQKAIKNLRKQTEEKRKKEKKEENKEKKEKRKERNKIPHRTNKPRPGGPFHNAINSTTVAGNHTKI